MDDLKRFEQSTLEMWHERKGIKNTVKAKFSDATEVYIDFASETSNRFKFLVLTRVLIKEELVNLVCRGDYDPATSETLSDRLDMIRRVYEDTVIADAKRQYGEFDSSKISSM